LFGGAAAWFVLRRKHEFAARAMLTVALALGIVASAAWYLLAPQLAAMSSGRDSGSTVIVLPDSQATPDAQSGAAPSSQPAGENTQ
jgi:hypothetical protein